MSLFGNSVWCCPEIALITSCLKQAVDRCESKCLLEIGKKESRQLVADYIVAGARQIVVDSLGEGHWKDEEDFVLGKAHCWIFLAWMSSSMGMVNNVDGKFTPMNTTFYLEVVRSLNFEKFMVQCLYRVTEEAMGILTQEIVNCIGSCEAEEEKYFVLEIIENCLKQLPKDWNRLSNVLSIITHGISHEALKLKIIERLAQEMQLVLESILKSQRDGNEKENEKGLNHLGYSVNLFTEKQNVVEFEGNIKWFLNEANIKSASGFHPVIQVESFQAISKSALVIQDQHSDWKPELKSSTHGDILNLACYIQQLITDKWSSLFCWGLECTGSPVIQSLKEPNWHAVLFDIFTTCLSWQRHVKVKEEERRLHGFVDVLKAYFQSHATAEEKDVINEILSEKEVQETRKELTSGQGESDNILNQELEKAIFKIEENLHGDEKCFEWLLMTEELYQDNRWLECVLGHALKFVSTTVVKMLIDVLCVLYESAASQSDSHQKNIYHSFQQVILDLIPCLSLQEQVDAVVYSFDQTCLHFKSCKDQSFFFLPNDLSACMNETTKLLTGTMNKIVNKAEESFSQDVLTGITKAALISPYLTLKALLTEAIKHAGYEKVICEVLQRMPQFAGLRSTGDADYLLVRAINEMLKTLTSKKQEGQFLKLITALLQPYSHTVLKIKEPPLLAAREIMREIIDPLLTIEDNGDVSPTLALNIFLTTLSCSRTTPPQQHWILDEKPFEVLFTLLEMYQDCTHFWQDWVSDESGNEVMDRDDFALDEAWTEMNVVVKILEEHLIPLMTEAICQEPSRYASRSEWVESGLDNLDWIASMQLIPLLQNNVISRGIKLPKSLVHLVTCQLNVVSLDDTESSETFWTMYFKSGAISNEVFGMYLSKLKDHHPKGTGDNSDCETIVESLASILPFSTWLQWQRLLNIGRELLKYGYLELKKEKWAAELVDLPEVDDLDPSCGTVNISFLLVSILHCISTKVWATTYVWNTTLKNYVSMIKQLSLSIGKPDEFVVTCHLLAHLTFIAFKVVPQGFHENIAIVMLDVLNVSISTIPNIKDKDLKPFEYLRGIIDTIPLSELRTTMVNKVERVVSNNAK